MKTVQVIRLIDIFVIAPFLFSIGRKQELTRHERIIVNAIAAGTLAYNLVNFLSNLKTK